MSFFEKTIVFGQTKLNMTDGFVSTMSDFYTRSHDILQNLPQIWKERSKVIGVSHYLLSRVDFSQTQLNFLTLQLAILFLTITTPILFLTLKMRSKRSKEEHEKHEKMMLDAWLKERRLDRLLQPRSHKMVTRSMKT